MGRSIDTIVADRPQKEKLVWEAREWVMFCAKTIEAQMPGFWRDIFSSAQKLVDDYRSASNDARLQEKLTFEKLLPNGLRAVKSTVPAVIIRANPDYGSHTIEYAVTRISHRDATPVETTGRLRIVLDDAGELCVRTDNQLLGTPQLVAELILRPLLRALSEAQ
jgi:hypothetical protein